MRSVLTLHAATLILSFAAQIGAHAAEQSGYPGGHREALGPLYDAAPQAFAKPAAHAAHPVLAHWNSIAVDASGLDHTPVAPGDPRTFGEQLGPARASRAMAIVHIAMFEAANSIARRYRSYAGIARVPGADIDAAMAQAACDTLVALFPSQADSFRHLVAQELASMRGKRARDLGIELGHRAATAILAMRADDGSAQAELRMDSTYVPGQLPGEWRQDPISLGPVALGALWHDVAPFVLASAEQFRIPPPPALDSSEYASAYHEVQAYGGDGIVTPTVRSAEQTEIGTFWAYDGTPSLCAPPRLYNQIAMHIARQMHTDTVDMARLLALVNTAMADAGIAAWESKYYYGFWRPVTGIRESDAGTGPSGLGDGNPLTVGDPQFTPLGAPASNLIGPNFTPPFPSYPSGHATFGGAVFQTLRRFYRTDKIAFTLVSDEYNGSTRDRAGNLRPLRPRSFRTLSEAEEENGQSRIYLGIHWAFDKTEGINQGRRIADYVFDHAFQVR